MVHKLWPISYGLHNYGVYNYGLYSHGLYSYGEVVDEAHSAERLAAAYQIILQVSCDIYKYL